MPHARSWSDVFVADETLNEHSECTGGVRIGVVLTEELNRFEEVRSVMSCVGQA